MAQLISGSREPTHKKTVTNYNRRLSHKTSDKRPVWNRERGDKCVHYQMSVADGAGWGGVGAGWLLHILWDGGSKGFSSIGAWGSGGGGAMFPLTSDDGPKYL